jgi:hypothetical protein
LATLSIKKRSEIIAKLKCANCGSTFAVEVSTKRVTKGRGAKEREALVAAAHAKEVAEARERNAKIGPLLIAMPGCTCQQRNDVHYNSSPREDAGHYLSTGWSRSKSGAMVPVLPRHFHQCPKRDTEEEAAILVEVKAQLGAIQ